MLPFNVIAVRVVFPAILPHMTVWTVKLQILLELNNVPVKSVHVDVLEVADIEEHVPQFTELIA